MVLQFVRLGAFGMALLFAAPALAKSSEPPARQAAAIADYRQTCRPLISPYIEFYVNHPYQYYRRTRERATSSVDEEFLEERDATYSTNPAGQYGLLGEQGLRVRVRNATQEALNANPAFMPPFQLGKCAAEVALRHALNGVPGYDRGAGSSRPSAPAPRPNVAVRPIPKPSVAKPTMSDQEVKTEALNRVVMDKINAIIARYPKKILPCVWRPAGSIQPPCIKYNSERGYVLSEAILALVESRRSELGSSFYAKGVTTFQSVRKDSLDACARLSASTTPCVLPVSASNRPPLKGRIIARDGRNAMACVHLETLGGDSSTSGGGRVIANRCEDAVEVGWCTMGGECERDLGNMTTIQPGRSWAVSKEKEVRFGACHGANTIHGDPGSKGLKFTCSKPEK